MLAKILETINKNAFLIVLVLLVSFFSFQLGRLSNDSSGAPIKIQNTAIQEIFNDHNANMRIDAIDFRVVVSKNGSKWHYLWCPGAKQIKEENKIYFDSEAEAVSAGYTLAANCAK